MALPKILVLVLAGGEGSRMQLLTETRAKPAVPFAGVYRLIDFPLSNCEHSGIADVWVSVQYQPQSVNEHLANGRPWDLDRTTGGLMMLPPFQSGSERGGFTSGTADGLWRQAELIRQFAPDALVVVSSDAVYKLDYREVAEGHLASDAEVTMVTTEVDPDDASRYGIVQLDGERVTDYAYKPDEPATTTATNEVFVFSPGPTLDRLEELATEVGEDGLDDLGTHLLPAQTRDGKARAHRFDGYWRDLGTVESYWQAHRDFLSDEPPIDLDEAGWPVHTRGGRHSAARVLDDGQIENSLLSGGTRVSGNVRGSVLSPGVVVEAGATVTDSVLLPGVRVRAGATVTRAVLDDDVVVGEGATVGGDGDITLVGRKAEVEVGATLAPGTRLPEPERD